MRGQERPREPDQCQGLPEAFEKTKQNSKNFPLVLGLNEV